MLVHTILAALGLAALILANPGAYDLIRYAGAAYLAWLAYSSWTDTTSPEPVSGNATLIRAFRRGFVTNILNPKVALFVLAFLPQFTRPEVGPIWQQILWLGIFLSFFGIFSDGTIGFFAGKASEKLKARAGLLNKISAIVFGGLSARLVFD